MAKLRLEVIHVAASTGHINRKQDEGRRFAGTQYERVSADVASDDLGEWNCDLRCVAKAVVVSYCFNATRACYGDVAVVVPEVDSDHRHRSHGWYVLGAESTLPL